MEKFDVFLCHNTNDKPAVIQVAEQLKQCGIVPWLDIWHLPPGFPWQPILEQQIDQIGAAAVFVGGSGIGPWQSQEIDAFLREFVKRQCPVIPVLLPDAPTEPKLPPFLQGFTWVDFRLQYPEPMGQLTWGITGQTLAKSDENKRGREKGEKFRVSSQATKADDDEQTNNTNITVLDAVNAALYLRRPLLVTGNPGSGKTSLAYAIAHELQLGSVLTWAITSRSTLQDGLYDYDAIARLQDYQLNKDNPEQKQSFDIGQYITLGPVGTAFLPSLHPRVLLIDEIDKSDINLPNDLLHLFEEGKFAIPELVRWADTSKNQEYKTVKVRTEDSNIKAAIKAGRVHCSEFPIIIMTSNGERDFPPAFVRRCLRVKMPDPDQQSLTNIIKSHFTDSSFTQTEQKTIELIHTFLGKEEQERATDQLLNAVYMRNNLSSEAFTPDLQDLLFKSLSATDES